VKIKQSGIGWVSFISYPFSRDSSRRNPVDLYVRAKGEEVLAGVGEGSGVVDVRAVGGGPVAELLENFFQLRAGHDVPS
jgi:hypothetical protein